MRYRALLLVAAAGCAEISDASSGFGPAEIRTDGRVRFVATTTPSTSTAGWLATTVLVIGASPGGVSLEYSGCPVIVRMYAGSERTGKPAWDALSVPNTACPLPLLRRHLGLGEALPLTALTLPREVLGDSLPPGRYYAAAIMRPNGDSVIVAAGEVDLGP